MSVRFRCRVAGRRRHPGSCAVGGLWWLVARKPSHACAGVVEIRPAHSRDRRLGFSGFSFPLTSAGSSGPAEQQSAEGGEAATTEAKFNLASLRPRARLGICQHGLFWGLGALRAPLKLPRAAGGGFWGFCASSLKADLRERTEKVTKAVQAAAAARPWYY